MKTVLANKQQTITFESKMEIEKIFFDQRFKLAHPNLLCYVTCLSSNACKCKYLQKTVINERSNL